MMVCLQSATRPPSPALPARGRVSVGAFDETVSQTDCGPSPLAGEVERGGWMPSYFS